jgi:hypothetical protein
MTQTIPREPSSSRGRGEVLILALVGLGVFAVYIALERGKLVGADGSVMASVAQNLWVHRSLKECCNAFGAFPKDPGPWSKFGIGYSLALAPLWRFQLGSNAQGGVWLGIANPVFLALATVVLAKTGLLLGWRRSTAVLAALAFALLTMAPEYSAEFLSEPGITLAMSLLLLGVALWPRRMTLSALLIGVGGMIAVLFRSDSIVLVLPAAAGILASKQWQIVFTAWKKWIFAIGIPVALSVAWTLYYDWLRYGKVLQFGYSGVYDRLGFSTPVLDGIGLQLWSPGKSFFVYAPILIAALPGFYWLARNNSRVVVAAALLCVLRIVFYARWWTPIGGSFAWGPRFLMPLCGVLALPLGATIERVRDLRLPARRAAVGLLGLLAAASAIVQFSSIAVDRSRVAAPIKRVDPAAHLAVKRGLVNQRLHRYEWTFGGNHVLYNLGHIAQGRWTSLYWFRDGPSVFGLAMLAAAVLLCGAAIAVAFRSDRRHPARR